MNGLLSAEQAVQLFLIIFGDFNPAFLQVLECSLRLTLSTPLTFWTLRCLFIFNSHGFSLSNLGPMMSLCIIISHVLRFVACRVCIFRAWAIRTMGVGFWSDKWGFGPMGHISDYWGFVKRDLRNNGMALYTGRLATFKSVSGHHTTLYLPHLISHKLELIAKVAKKDKWLATFAALSTVNWWQNLLRYDTLLSQDNIP